MLELPKGKAPIVPTSCSFSKMRRAFKTTLRCLLIGWVLSAQEIDGLAETNFSCDKKAELTESFDISCIITGNIVNGIQWTRPDATLVTACSDTTTCLTFVSGYTVISATSSENILNIASVVDIDYGRWTCQDGSGGVKGCEIIVQKTPTASLTILSTKQIYYVGDTLEVSVEVRNYYCSKVPSFHLLLDIHREELNEIPMTPLTILNGTQTKSINVTGEMTGSIKLVFNCRDDDVLPSEKTFKIPASTTTTVKTTTATSPSSPTLYIILGAVFGGVLFIILIIGLCCCCCYCRRKQKRKEGNGDNMEFKDKGK